MPIALRPDFDAARLRRAARASMDADQARRLLALAAIYDGGSRSEAAAAVILQIVRDWVLKFNAHGPEWADRSQGAWMSAAADRGASGGPDVGARERADRVGAWRGALADH